MMFNSSNADLKHFFNATRSLRSFTYVVRRLVAHLWDLLRYRRAVQSTSGNALAARLARAALDAGVPIWTSAPIKHLLVQAGSVVGAGIEREGTVVRVNARRGVVLACGGFPHDPARMKQAYPHMRRGAQHMSPTPEENTGDGIRLAEQVGGACQTGLPHAAAWMPVSRVPFSNGSYGLFPHLLDRYKPGVIGVNRAGRRFCNESDSYHDVGAAMIRDGSSSPDTSNSRKRQASIPTHCSARSPSSMQMRRKVRTAVSVVAIRRSTATWLIPKTAPILALRPSCKRRSMRCSCTWATWAPLKDWRPRHGARCAQMMAR